MMRVTAEWNGDEVIAELNGAIPDALNYAAELLRGWAVEAAPIRDGPLRASAQVTPASGGNEIAHVSFDTVYAWRQHEELSWNHPGGGGAKYLEGPLLSRNDELLEAIASRLRRVF
ncbi:hypothetical protein PQI23_13345 [Leucobacter sp. USCH14]|uniref:hypothetical protein n=1 Tax=Leucobacter sp. USCH14 TaxID=3024838 RepID=UPI0030A93486